MRNLGDVALLATWHPLTRVKAELCYYRLLASDRRVPWYARGLVWLGVAYFVLPFDLVPDFIPVFGQLDDLLLVPDLITAGVLLTPRSVREELRRDCTLDATIS